MTTHKCSRDDCPRENVNGPKSKCAKCGNLCYLRCFGIEKRENIENTEIVKISLTNGTSMFTFLPYCVFSCCKESLTNTELKKVLKMPKASRASSKSRQTQENVDIPSVLTELSEIKGIISEIKGKANEIHADTQVIVEKSMERNVISQSKHVNRNITSINTPNTSKLAYKQTPIKSFADIIRSNPTRNSAKRQRPDNTPEKAKFEAPKPMMGKKTVITRLNVVAKPKRVEKPTFKKAIWVSGFDPMTTSEEIVDYIVSETSVSDKLKFNVHKLVKKDKDMTTLKFVSFKIGVNEEEFDTLCDPDTWPEHVFVREFLQNKTLGDFFPQLKSQQTLNSTSPECMEVAESQNNQNTSTSEQIAKKSPSKKSPNNPNNQ